MLKHNKQTRNFILVFVLFIICSAIVRTWYGTPERFSLWMNDVRWKEANDNITTREKSIQFK